jgi:hypothetical protein
MVQVYFGFCYPHADMPAEVRRCFKLICHVVSSV